MLEVASLGVRFGGVVALADVSVRLSAPVSGIIGPNGAGKTTLMNVLSGFVQPSAGSVRHGGQDLLRLAPHRRAHWGLRRSFQKDEIADDLSALDNVRAQLDALPGRAGAKTAEARRLLDGVGLGARADAPGADLNSYERRLCDVARCMAGAPRLVIFDEPAGGLSVDETRRLGALIRAIPAGTGAQVLLIDHDVDLIREVCDETLVLDFGRAIAFGATAQVLADPRVKAAYLGIEEARE